MNADLATPPTDVPFKPAGPGHNVLHLCAFCNGRRPSLGSKRVGRLKRFCCAECLKNRGAQR